MYCRVGVSVHFIQTFYSIVQMYPCSVVGVSIKNFHYVLTSEVVCLTCFIIQQKCFTLVLKSSKVELWGGLPFARAKGYYKVLKFGYKYSKLSTNGKEKINKRVKYVV